MVDADGDRRFVVRLGIGGSTTTPGKRTRQQLAERCIEEKQRLRLLRRDFKKLTKRLERAIDDFNAAIPPGEPWLPPEEAPPPPPRWLLSGEQLHTIANRLNLASAGTYSEVAKELGIDGDLYAMIEETYRAAGRPGVYHTDGFRPEYRTMDAKGEWLESYRDAKHAYAWHLAVATDRAAAKAQGDTDV